MSYLFPYMQDINIYIYNNYYNIYIYINILFNMIIYFIIKILDNIVTIKYISI